MTIEPSAVRERASLREANCKDLAASHIEPCLSIYTSECSGPDGANRCLSRISKLLRTAEPKLRNMSMTIEDAENILASNWHTVGEGEPRHPVPQGLAIFLSKDYFGYCWFPARVANRVDIARQFFLRPVLPFLPTDDRFFVLALSQKHVRLFEGSRQGMHERILRDIPANLRDDLEALHMERHYQMHTASSPPTRQKGAVFHGAKLEHKDRLIHFFRDVDRGVAASLKAQRAPLIVASVDYLFPIYREANTYPHLLDETIDGNPDLRSADTLYEAAWKIFEEQSLKAAARAFSLFKEHIDTPLTSRNLREVLTAAQSGWVRFLFIPPSGEEWGSLVSPDVVHLHANREPGDEDLLNLAAILTIRHGGHVHVVPSEQLPQGARIAATFRFGSSVATTA